MATPEEIANAVVFFASSKASYITGISMSMDGALNPIVV
jgi:NAD(P)-dependent dehydrogenase (short-subunit alcohol dehydrogenase family)